MNETNQQLVKKVYLFIAIFLPLFILGIYLIVGSPGIITNPLQLENTITTNEGNVIDLDNAVQILEDRINDNPNDFQAKTLLIKTLISLNRNFEALAKLKQLQNDNEKDVELLILEANIYVKMANGIIDNKTKSLIPAIERLDPNHHVLYWLKGVLANQENNFAKAKEYFELSMQNTTDPNRHEELNKLIRLNDLDLKIIVANN